MIPGFGRTGFGRHQIYPDLWVITFYHIFNIPHYPTFPHKSTINGPFSMDSMQVINLQGGAPYLAKSDYNSNFTMIYDRYSISIVTNWFINQRSHHWGGTTLYFKQTPLGSLFPCQESPTLGHQDWINTSSLRKICNQSLAKKPSGFSEITH